MSEDRLAVECSRLENRIKLLRRIVFLISKPDFRQTFTDAGPQTQDSVIRLIREERDRPIREWWSRSRVIAIEDMSARQLHQLARAESICNYKRIGTEELRSELIRLRDS